MTGETTRRFPTAIRCGAILAAQPGYPADLWEDAIKSAAAAVREALPEADIIGLVPIENDREPSLHALYRKLGRPIDGTISLTLPSDADPRRMLAAAPVLRRALADAIDSTGCVANLGEAMYALTGYGAYAYTMLAFLDARINQQQFIDWWSGHHSEMGLDSATSSIMAGYGVQLRYDSLTSEMNQALGFSDKGDLFELVYIDDVEGWRRMVTPDVLKGFCEDEKGYLAHEGARVAIQRVVSKYLGKS